MQNETDVVLHIEALNKAFGITKAVVDATLDIKGGCVMGLVGENGSGKSTLSNLIAGVLKPDSGKMLKKGEPYSPPNMVDARNKGIFLVMQEEGMIPNLSVAENVFLGRETVFSKLHLVNMSRIRKETKKVLELAKLEMDPDANTAAISMEDRKLIEVAAAASEVPDLIIFDETTTTLSSNGRDIVFNIIRDLKAKGKAVIFISHLLDEVTEICDEVTVMRDGHIIRILTGDEITVDNIRQNMIGRELSNHFYRNDWEEQYEDEVVLEVDSLCLAPKYDDISFKLHKGEILGVGGLSDCGMHELGKSFFGIVKADKGSIVTKNGSQIRNPQNALKSRIGYVPKDRDTQSVMLGGSVRDNIVLMASGKTRSGIILSKRKEKALTKEYVEKMQIKTRSIKGAVFELSGGNKQKVALSKWLANDSDILILDCPTRGIDIGVKEAVYQLMMDLKKRGISMILISEELPELIGMSDNLMILKHGRIAGTFKRSDKVSESDLITCMI